VRVRDDDFVMTALLDPGRMPGTSTIWLTGQFESGEMISMTQSGVDELLSSLIQALDEPRWSTEITLSVGGLLITGTPISESEYLEHLGVQIDESLQKAGAGHPTLKQTLVHVATEVQSLRDSGVPRDSVLLAQATLFAGGPTSVSVPLWRVPLIAVSGWTFGRAC
jgi:hypothetical protein